jgi:hypothetical protein
MESACELAPLGSWRAACDVAGLRRPAHSRGELLPGHGKVIHRTSVCTRRSAYVASGDSSCLRTAGAWRPHLGHSCAERSGVDHADVQTSLPIQSSPIWKWDQCELD